MDKSMVEVLQMNKETREQWMQQVKGKEYSTTRMDDCFDVGESQPRAPKETAGKTARAPSNNNKLTAMGFKRMRNGEQRDRETENEEVVEVETGNNDTTQDQTQTEQRGGHAREGRRRAYTPCQITQVTSPGTSCNLHHQHGGQ
jgi:hypothetical protein